MGPISGTPRCLQQELKSFFCVVDLDHSGSPAITALITEPS